MKHSWENMKLSKILFQYREEIWIDDTKVYPQLTNSKYDGIGLRGKKIGAEIGRKRQFVVNLDKYPNTITFTRQTIQVDEAIGLCPLEVNGCIVTENMPLFKIENAEPKFIEYFFRTRIFLDQLHRTAAIGTSQQSVHEDIFLNYEILLPPLPEQQRIVSKIERVKQRIEEIKKIRVAQTKDINNLLFSKYTDLIKNVDWLPMKEVAPIIRREVKLSDEGLYPELGIRCFGKGTFHKPAITGLEVATKKIFQIKKGDLVFSNVFAWEGGIAIAKEEDNDRYGSHRFISCVADKEKALEEFLCFHFLSPKGLEDINACSPGGAGRNKTLGLDKLMKIKIPIPDINLQEEFVELLHKVNAIKEQHSETEKELTELMPSLLDKAFKGEL